MYNKVASWEEPLHHRLTYGHAYSTDLLIASGHLPSPYPCTVGHEGAGRVIKTGKNVSRTKVGDEVLLSFAYCQTCKTCEAGHPAGCRVSPRLPYDKLPLYLNDP